MPSLISETDAEFLAHEIAEALRRTLEEITILDGQGTGFRCDCGHVVRREVDVRTTVHVRGRIVGSETRYTATACIACPACELAGVFQMAREMILGRVIPAEGGSHA